MATSSLFLHESESPVSSHGQRGLDYYPGALSRFRHGSRGGSVFRDEERINRHGKRRITVTLTPLLTRRSDMDLLHGKEPSPLQPTMDLSDFFRRTWCLLSWIWRTPAWCTTEKSMSTIAKALVPAFVALLRAGRPVPLRQLSCPEETHVADLEMFAVALMQIRPTFEEDLTDFPLFFLPGFVNVKFQVLSITVETGCLHSSELKNSRWNRLHQAYPVSLPSFQAIP